MNPSPVIVSGGYAAPPQLLAYRHPAGCSYPAYAPPQDDQLPLHQQHPGKIKPKYKSIFGPSQVPFLTPEQQDHLMYHTSHDQSIVRWGGSGPLPAQSVPRTEGSIKRVPSAGAQMGTSDPNFATAGPGQDQPYPVKYLVPPPVAGGPVPPGTLVPVYPDPTPADSKQRKSAPLTPEEQKRAEAEAAARKALMDEFHRLNPAKKSGIFFKDRQYDLPFVMKYLQRGMRPEDTDTRHKTPLQIYLQGVTHIDMRVVQVLATKESVNNKDTLGNTALHYAECHKSYRGRECVEYLLSVGADYEAENQAKEIPEVFGERNQRRYSDDTPTPAPSFAVAGNMRWDSRMWNQRVAYQT